jgi:hypothetical protein
MERVKLLVVVMSDVTQPLFCFLFLWLYSPIQALAASMKLSISLLVLDLGQSVGLLGRVISSSQGLYLDTNTEKRTHNTNTKHPCQKGDSNLRSRRPRNRRQLMPSTARLPWPALLNQWSRDIHVISGQLGCVPALKMLGVTEFSSWDGNSASSNVRTRITFSEGGTWKIYLVVLAYSMIAAPDFINSNSLLRSFSTCIYISHSCNPSEVAIDELLLFLSS